jgi:hypothetical protein
MSGPWKKVSAGQRFAPPAALWNEMIDVVDFVRDLRRNGGAIAGEGLGADGAIVSVQNNSGADRDQFEVLAISAPVYDPATALAPFKQFRALAGVAPDVGSFTADGMDGRFGVLLQPIRSGGVGRAMVAGVVQCQVNLTATWHFRADIADGDCAKLTSYPGGSARILAIDREATGTKWAWVQLGVNPLVTYYGELDGPLAPDSSATLSIAAPVGYGDSTLDVTVHPGYIQDHSDLTLPTGNAVQAAWDPIAMQLRSETWECP